MKMYKLFTICFFVITSLLQAQDYFPPQGEWEERAASQFDINQERLTRAVNFAEENEYTGARDLRQAILKGFEQEPFHEISGPTKKRGGPAGMIIKDGYVISSWGDTQRVDMTFSVTKSFLSTTGLLALQEGLIADAGDKVDQYVWDGTFDGQHNSKVTWKHLLDQSSDWSGQLWGGYDWADRPPSKGGLDDWRNRQLNEPGSVFTYNDVRVNLLAYSLLHVWRQPLPQVLKERIMDPIQASPTWRWFGYENAWVDIDGLKMQSVTGGGHSGGGLFINTEDMARFGLLFARNGKWEGEQLLSEELIEEAIQPSPANENYGYMWWLNKKGSRHWEGLPEHIFYAAGFGGNFIIIDRERDLVIVTRWLEPSKIAEFTKLVYEAL
jgi:CubicO group peptidase (beta-lactamase class C family)